MGLSHRLALLGELVTFSHSLFALPFALIMVVQVSESQRVTALQIFLLIFCVLAARTAAMAFNRYVDAQIDMQNPRTVKRSIPRGAVSKVATLLIVISSSLAFLWGASQLGAHCGVLSPLVLLLLLAYSFVKRFSALCHFVLGLALALAPGGVWFALTGEWSWQPVPLMATVMLWVAGFDVLYSCQDVDFDRSARLYSIPARIGILNARRASFVLHAMALCMLGVNGVVFTSGIFYWTGLGVFGALLCSQHVAVMRRGIECIDRVFFTRNGAASVALFLFVLVDALI